MLVLHLTVVVLVRKESGLLHPPVESPVSMEEEVER